MKKLLFLLALSAMTFASADETPKSYTYIETGMFTHSFKGNAIATTYGTRKFYTPKIAFDVALFNVIGFKQDFLIAAKSVWYYYLPTCKSTFTPYIGVGGFAGMLSYKDKDTDREVEICANALGILGAEVNIKQQKYLVSATYHLHANSLLLSVGKVF